MCYFFFAGTLLLPTQKANAQASSVTKQASAHQHIISAPASNLNGANIVLPVHTGSFPINSTGQHCVSDQVMDAYLEANGLKAQFQAQYEQMLHEIEYNQPVDKGSQ